MNPILFVLQSEDFLELIQNQNRRQKTIALGKQCRIKIFPVSLPPSPAEKVDIVILTGFTGGQMQFLNKAGVALVKAQADRQKIAFPELGK